MTDQFEFPFGEPTARGSDPETSWEAAHDAQFNASYGRMLVMKELYAKGPLTDFELADITGWQQTSIGKRRHECMMAGLVEVLKNGGGQVVKRPAPSGSSARVWKLSSRGSQYINNAS